MSSFLTVELPPPLPALPPQQQVTALSEALDQGFKTGKSNATALKLQALKARLNAMRLAPLPANPREAVHASAEAARLAREVKALEPNAGADPAIASEVDAAVGYARTVIAKSRKAVKPGSHEDQTLLQMEADLAGSGVSISV
jgi:hypothetical protein